MNHTEIYINERRAYNALLQENQRILRQIEERQLVGTYPLLSAFLLARGSSKLNRLVQLHEYFLAYDAMPSYDYAYGRGVEMMASRQALIDRFRGGKDTWQTAIRQFCTLGLLHVYNPRVGKVRNTTAQDESAMRAAQESHKPVAWYRVPQYTKDVLKLAESRAGIVKRLGSGLDKNSVRDLVGPEEANEIFDSGWDIGEFTQAYRTALDAALVDQIGRQGFAYPDDVLRQAQKQGPSGAIAREWRAYRPIALEYHGLQYGRPSRQQMADLGLTRSKYIISNLDR